MKITTIAILFALTACGDVEQADTPAQKALKDECKALLLHVVSISPQLKDSGMTAEERAAKLPVEDVQQCTASEPEIRGCMMTATSPEAVKKCIPSDAIIGCMRHAAKVPEVRAKCWAGDAHAADKLPAEAS